MTKQKCVFFGSDIFRNSLYGDNHPLNIARVWPAIDICTAEGWLEAADYQEIAPASIERLSKFHSADYVAALWQAQTDQTLPDELKDKFQIGRASNPIFKEVYSRPATAANASYLGAKYLAEGRADIVYNPSGGTHHGMRGFANGFCFVNDPAIALETLSHHTSDAISYIDIDAHHCDGVQTWHADNQQIQIISLHQAGLWPRTGQEGDKGGGNAHNFLLQEGAGDYELLSLMEQRVMSLIEAHQPSFIILQAGADGHRDDPQSRLNYTLQGYWRAASHVLGLSKPTMVLGGGGYNPYITAKAWAGLWALITNRDPYDLGLSDASVQLLTRLSWHHRLGRNPQESWFTQLGDIV